MSKITKIYPLPANPPQYPEAKVLVYIDGQKCVAVRERTWQAMKLKAGDTITCDELKQREIYHWKLMYGKSSWEKEKVRLEKVSYLIESIDKRIKSEIVGFGADSTDLILEHPEESGKPDIAVHLRKTMVVLIFAEVTGTETMRGSAYWVRPDKLKYANNHIDQDVWIILHYAKPVEKFVFIKPIPGKSYSIVNKVIKGSTEFYVEFSDADVEVVPFDTFKNHLIRLIETASL